MLISKETLTAIRLMHKLTAGELADKLNITKTYLSLLENGKKPISKKISKQVIALYPSFNIDVSVKSYIVNEILARGNYPEGEVAMLACLEVINKLVGDKK